MGPAPSPAPSHPILGASAAPGLEFLSPATSHPLKLRAKVSRKLMAGLWGPVSSWRPEAAVAVWWGDPCPGLPGSGGRGLAPTQYGLGWGGPRAPGTVVSAGPGAGVAESSGRHGAWGLDRRVLAREAWGAENLAAQGRAGCWWPAARLAACAEVPRWSRHLWNSDKWPLASASGSCTGDREPWGLYPASTVSNSPQRPPLGLSSCGPPA